MMYGLLHDLSGAPIVVEPRILKVGIGLPKGTAINVYRLASKWQIQVGFKGKDCPSGPKYYSFDTRQECEAAYRKLKPTAPECSFPRKVGYFTFTRQAADGTFEPDWRAIEEHGELPTEIDVLFLTDNPLDAAYQMWSTAELRCKGDGLNAERILSMASTPEEKALADQAKAAGQRYFPIVEQCWTRNCRYVGVKQGCKPGADLKFQLVNSLRIGGTAYFHTTGFRSIRNLFSCIQILKTFTAPPDPETGVKDPEAGHIAGIPLKLVVRPYHAKHEGKISTQYGISIEFREETVESLARKLLGQARRFQQLTSGAGAADPGPRQVAAPEVRMLPAPPEEIPSDEDEEMRARGLMDEFDGGNDEEDAGGQAAEAPAATAAAPQAATTAQAQPEDAPAAKPARAAGKATQPQATPAATKAADSAPAYQPPPPPDDKDLF